MSSKDIRIDSLWMRNDPKKEKRTKKIEKPHSAESKLPDTTGIFDDVPATPSPPKKPKSSFKTPPPGFSQMRNKHFENKTLSMVRNEFRANKNQSMISSPSIMSLKPSSSIRHVSGDMNSSIITLDDSNNESIRNNPLELMDIDKIFDDLKNSEEEKLETAVVETHESKSHIEPPSDVGKSTNEAKSEAIDFPAIKQFQSDWSGINFDAVHHLKQSVVNFRPILDELQKANAKIIEFRRSLNCDK